MRWMAGHALSSVGHGLERLGPDRGEVDSGVHLLVELPDDSSAVAERVMRSSRRVRKEGNIYGTNGSSSHLHVVAADDVQAQHLLLHSLLGGEDALVALVKDEVRGLVEAPEVAHDVAAIVRDDGDHLCGKSSSTPGRRQSHRAAYCPSRGFTRRRAACYASSSFAHMGLGATYC